MKRFNTFKRFNEGVLLKNKLLSNYIWAKQKFLQLFIKKLKIKRISHSYCFTFSTVNNECI